MEGDDADSGAFARTDVATPLPATSDDRDTVRGFERSPTDPAPPEPAPGAKIGRYRLIGRIGGGAMGVVWRARDPKLDRDIAIKLVHPSLARIPDAAARLLREARALAKVSHSAVVAVHDAGQEDDRLFLAMELVEGTTLGTILRDRRPGDLREWRRTLAMLIEAGNGLAAAHGAGVLHRDFKPDNVLVSSSGRVCVADFGLAEIVAGAASSPRRPSTGDAADSWQLESVDSLTITGAVVGTPAYMAPEQMRGAVVDARSDQFSFCVAAYEALYGQRPFDYKPGPDQPPALALLLEIEGGEVRPAPRDSKVPRWLREVIVRGFAAAPGDRWPDMRALLAALQPRPRYRRWVVAGALAVACAATLAFLALRDTDRPRPVERELFPLPMSQRIQSSKDGRWIAYADEDRIYVRDLEAVTPLPREHGMGGIVDHIELESADIVLASVIINDQLVLRRWHVLTGTVEDVRPLAGWYQWFGSLDGGDLVSRVRGTTYELAVSTTAVEVIATSSQKITAVPIAPGRRRVAFIEDDGFRGRLVIHDLDRHSTITSPALVEPSGLAWINDDRVLYSTGMSEHPTLWTANATTAGLAAPTAVWSKPAGWFGYLSVAGDRIHFVNSATSFAARWIDRDQPGVSRELDPASVAAGLGWTDEGGPLGWQRVSEHVVEFDVGMTRVEVKPTPAMFDGEVGNTTRAADVMIVSVRRRGAREVIAVSLTDGHRLWSLKPGAGLLVRCAGDAAPPCYLVRTGAAGVAEIVSIDPGSGEIGAALPGPPVVKDIAVARDGLELIVADGGPALQRISLRDPVPSIGPYLVTALATIRGVVHDPRGGVLVTGTRRGQLYQLIQVTEDGDDADTLPDELIIAQSSNDLFSVPRPSPTGDRIIVLGRRYLPVIFELRGAL